MIAELKQSGVKWIGDIPEHWDVMPLYGVFNERFIKNKEGQEGNVLSLSYGRIVKRNIEDNFGLMPESFNTYQIVDRGNIILRLTDLQNDKRSLRVGLVQEKGIISSAYVCLELRENVSPEYFFYLIHNYDIKKIFYNLGAGVRQSMGFSDLKRMPLIVPPKDEQDEIVSHIKTQSEKINHFIRKKQCFIELLKEQRQSVINEMVTKGGYGWSWLRLKDVATVNDEALPDSTKDDYLIKYIDIGNVNSYGDVAEFQEFIFKEAPSRARRIIKKGDVIISTVRTYLKAITLIESEETNLIASTGFAVLRPKEKILSEYLNLALRSEYFINSVIQNSYGVSYPAINSSTLSAMKILIPDSPDLQQEILKQIKAETQTIDTAINKAEKEIDLIKEYKEAMIAEAVMGKY